MQNQRDTCNMFRMLVYDYESQIWISVRFNIAFLDMAVGKPGWLTLNLFRGSYSHAHWVTFGPAAIVIN